MHNVYPKAKVEAAKVALDSEAACVDRIIESMDVGLSKGEAVGYCLQGADDVPTFERLWAEVEAEGATLRKVDASKFLSEHAYLTAISMISRHLDAQRFADGLLAEAGVADFKTLAAEKTTEV